MDAKIENPLDHYTDDELSEILKSLDDAIAHGAVEIPESATTDFKSFDDWMRKY